LSRLRLDDPAGTPRTALVIPLSAVPAPVSGHAGNGRTDAIARQERTANGAFVIALTL